MCGLVGVVARAGAPDNELIDSMRKVIAHRGPDAHGVWRSADGMACFGHNRLAVIDLSHDADQPMVHRSGRYAVVFNGEIYNFRALRDRLVGLGAEFRTASDTEVVLEAYAAWGVECVRYLDGMFALAIYDRDERRLFVARDRAGEKPLYYRRTPGALWFASELKALLANPEMPRAVAPRALDAYLAYGYVPGDVCMLAGYRKLRQGHCLIYDVDKDALQVRRYWRLPPPATRRRLSLADASRRVQELLSSAVERQLVADVPVGILLSGGLDSSLITALATRGSAGAVKTFTVTFPGHEEYNEGPYARKVAEFLGTQHTELVAEQSGFTMLAQLAAQFDEPIADHAILPTAIVSQLIRKHATVALGGDGGDELFGGYPHYSFVQSLERARHFIPRPVRGLISRGARKLPPGVRSRNHLVGFSQDLAHSLSHINLYFDARLRRRLVPALGDHAAYGYAEAQRSSLCDASLSPLQQATRVDFQTTMVDGYLVKVDRASMMHSLEVRAPFLDRAVVEFAFSELPDELRATRRERKVVLRDLAARLLPPDFDARRKQGFTMPLEDWLRGSWEGYVEDVLRSLDPSVFRTAVVEELLRGQRRGLRNAGRVFSLVMLELWRRHYDARLI